MLGLGVERGGWLVEYEQQRGLPHDAAGGGQLLPLAERDLDAAGPGRAELGFQPGREAVDHIVGAGPTDRGDDRGLVVEARHIANPNRVTRAELEAEEV